MIIDKKFEQELIETRRYLHAHPEISEKEFQTTYFIREKLKQWDIEILEGALKTGVVAQIGSGRPVIALRADIDALPILEKTELPYASKYKGRMHACGHDLHMTSLLGAAKLLKKERFKGTIKLIFQPAEEIGQGALQVLKSGLVNDVQAFVGYHNMPTLQAGEIRLKEGAMMAAVDRFWVVVRGSGSHAAYPQEGTDVVLGISTIVQNLQQIVARNLSPLHAAVVSVTHIDVGNTWNVLPDEGYFEGTIRSFDSESRQLIKKRFVEIAELTAKTVGLSAEVAWLMDAELTFNDANLTAIVRESLAGWYGPIASTEPSSAGEDFAHYRTQAPSLFAFIGSNAPEAPGLHFPEMTIKDETLATAVKYYVHSALSLLRTLEKPSEG